MASQTDPFGDVTRMVEQFRIPGVDMSAIVASRRKDIEVLVAANLAIYESIQALAGKQKEMLNQAMQSIHGAPTSAAAAAVIDPAGHAETARKAFEKTLADVKELAELARIAQTETMTHITQRASQHMQELNKLMGAGPG